MKKRIKDISGKYKQVGVYDGNVIVIAPTPSSCKHGCKDCPPCDYPDCQPTEYPDWFISKEYKKFVKTEKPTTNLVIISSQLVVEPMDWEKQLPKIQAKDYNKPMFIFNRKEIIAYIKDLISETYKKGYGDAKKGL